MARRIQNWVPCLLLLSALTQPWLSTNLRAAERDSDIDQYSANVAKAAQELIRLTPTHQQSLLRQPFSSTKRISGRNTSGTPSFCGVVAWCRAQGLAQGDMKQAQLFSLHRLLRQALSSGGYQSLLAVMNRQRIIGELESVADKNSVTRASELYPFINAPSMQSFSSLAYPTPRDWYPSVGGMTPLPDSQLIWTWSPPGPAIRKEQFDEYSLLISGNPGVDDLWGLRFEGHHITINITFDRDESGVINIFSTPLFIGAFPMVIPQSPSSKNNGDQLWDWTQGQSMLLGVTRSVKNFWLSLPDIDMKRAQIPSSSYEQSSPLLADTPPNYLITALDTHPDNDKIKNLNYIDINPRALSSNAVWNLLQAFEVYISPMHSDIAYSYRHRLNTALRGDKSIRLAWSGGDLSEIGSHHYSYIEVGGLLLELFQSNRFSTQHTSTPSGNHVHGMLRDLHFDWVYPNPIKQHHMRHHHHAH